MIEVKTKLKGGFLEQPTRLGVMLDFKRVKDEKLEARRAKYHDGVYSFRDLYGYFSKELAEMQVEWVDGNDPKALLRELADMSNAIDMMAWCLIEDDVR